MYIFFCVLIAGILYIIHSRSIKVKDIALLNEINENFNDL